MASVQEDSSDNNSLQDDVADALIGLAISDSSPAVVNIYWCL